MKKFTLFKSLLFQKLYSFVFMVLLKSKQIQKNIRISRFDTFSSPVAGYNFVTNLTLSNVSSLESLCQQ